MRVACRGAAIQFQSQCRSRTRLPAFRISPLLTHTSRDSLVSNELEPEIWDRSLRKPPISCGWNCVFRIRFILIRGTTSCDELC